MCEAGKFGTEDGASDERFGCEDCPPGRFMDLKGSAGFSSCKTCAAGKYQNEAVEEERAAQQQRRRQHEHSGDETEDERQRRRKRRA